ncbi:isoform 2 of ankyrin-2 [Fagus crenata]
MTSSIGQMNTEMESIKKELFKRAMHGEWDKVVEIYRKKPMAHEAKLTWSGDTALHIAVSDGQEERVEELVGSISAQRKDKEKKVLEIGNEKGNTPLHIAASMGNVAMCQCIAKVDKSLVGARNHGNETHFFLAALYGKKEVFLCFHELCGTENGYNYCRRKDGDTILHCAISGDYFGLAFRIIHLYEKLVNSFNQHGWTPLHILASKPSAFRSGSHFGGWYKMIYHCILVDELEHEPSHHQLNQNLEVVEVEKEPSDHQLNQNLEVVEVEKEPFDLNFKEIIIDKCEPKNSLKKNQKYPENYETCVNFFPLLWELVSFINIFRSFWNWVLVGILVDELEHEPSDHQLNQNLEVVEVEKEPSDQNLEVVEVEKEPSDHQLNQNLEVVEVEIEPSDLSFKEIIIDKSFGMGSGPPYFVSACIEDQGQSSSSHGS